MLVIFLSVSVRLRKGNLGCILMLGNLNTASVVSSFISNLLILLSCNLFSVSIAIC